MMIAGGPVKGGKVYGQWPGLKADQRFEGRDLAVTTDFRDVFSEIVTSHLRRGARTASPACSRAYTPRRAGISAPDLADRLEERRSQSRRPAPRVTRPLVGL